MKIKLKEDYVKIATSLGFDKEPNENIFRDFKDKELKVIDTWEDDGQEMYCIDMGIDLPKEAVDIL